MKKRQARVLINLIKVQFCLYMHVNAESVTQYQDPETKTAKWNTAIINLIIYTRPFPPMT